MIGTRISTASDFPHTAVYERDGPNGNIYTVAFNNREYSEGWRMVVAGVWFWGLVLSIFPAMAILPSGTGEWVFVIWLIANVGNYFYVKDPWKVKRAIELDFGADQLRVLWNGKAQRSRQLTRLASLSVEEHPNAEAQRVDRMAHGEKQPKRYEKQHCLFGWFGAGGAEQVMLVSRAEWPNRNSLFEVRQAVLWAIEKASSKVSASPGFEPSTPVAQTIKPPLD